MSKNKPSDVIATTNEKNADESQIKISKYASDSSQKHIKYNDTE
jgi:hypothetical protein